MKAREIRSMRRRYGWTQADLAARLGTDAVTVSRWERGATRPRPSAQTRLRELAAPANLAALARIVGDVRAERLLRRAELLVRRLPRGRFAADPTTRIRMVERLRSEQLALRKGVRPAP